MMTLSAFLLFQDSPHTVFYLHSPLGEGSATLGSCFGDSLMNSVVVFLIWNLMLRWYFMTGFSAAILKMEFGYEYGRLFQPPFMNRNWILTLML